MVLRYDLTDLQLFCAVAEAGNLTAGASTVHLAPASASARIHRLERAAGTPLLERLPRGMRLTAAGEALHAHARRVLAEAAAIEVELGRFVPGSVDEVRIAACPHALSTGLLDDLAAFGQQRPEARLCLEGCEAAEAERAVRDGRADLAVLEGEACSEDLAWMPYRQDRLVVLVPPGHRLAGQRAVRWRAVLDEPFVAHPRGSALQTLIDERAAAAGRRLWVRARLASHDAVCAAVAAGLGIAVLPGAASGARRQGAALDEPWALRAITLCARRDGVLPPLARELLAALALGGGAAASGHIEPGIPPG